MTHAERIAERRRDVRVLDEQGKTLREIALQLNVGRSTVHRDLEALKARTGGTENLQPWPPAEPGNTRAMTHGLDSPRVIGKVIEPRARELAPQIIDAHPHLDPIRDGAAAFRLAMVYARLEHAYTWLAERGDEMFADRDTGEVHGLLGRVQMWEVQAGREEERLAISPRERERLKLDKQKGRLLSLAGGTTDLSGLDDDELAVYRRLAAKAAGVEETEGVAA
jgi:hypothetical protein